MTKTSDPAGYLPDTEGITDTNMKVICSFQMPALSGFFKQVKRSLVCLEHPVFALINLNSLAP